jgi:hypothetical protein
MAASRKATLGCTAARKISAPSWSRSSIVNLNFGMGHGGGVDGGGIEIGGISQLPAIENALLDTV